MLREKQIAFCNEYVRCKNAALAAKRAGYSPDYGKALLDRGEIADFCRKQELDLLKEMGDTIEGTELREIIEERRAGLEVSDRETHSSPKKEKEGAKNPVIEQKKHSSAKNIKEGEKKTTLGKRIATADDVLGFLTEIMEGDEALRDRLRAAELLGKRYGLFKDTGVEEEDKCLVIVGEDRL